LGPSVRTILATLDSCKHNVKIKATTNGLTRFGRARLSIEVQPVAEPAICDRILLRAEIVPAPALIQPAALNTIAHCPTDTKQKSDSVTYIRIAQREAPYYYNPLLAASSCNAVGTSVHAIGLWYLGKPPFQPLPHWCSNRATMCKHLPCMHAAELITCNHVEDMKAGKPGGSTAWGNLEA
jgi:hypothetical protein